MNWIPNEMLVISSNKSMTILRKDDRNHGVLTLKFDQKRGRVKNAAAIANADEQFHISLTRPAVEELSASGMVFSGWQDLKGTHLGNPRGGSCYIKGYSGFESKEGVLDWFRKELPSGWSII